MSRRFEPLMRKLETFDYTGPSLGQRKCACHQCDTPLSQFNLVLSSFSMHSVYAVNVTILIN